ncbi:recombinase RecT [Roseibium sp.]|uniref:recombinase RecT n=1 Tax=Roseibium sp. TaxID=1936156 RepID=UPI001B2010F6|nr:recombinase RecT [Roseibium sp.]MBO6858335.1 recombinase RecT [Roseibium sp.]
MNQVATVEKKAQSRGLTAVMAERFQMDPARFVEAIKSTVIKGNVSDGQLAAFLMVAHEYGLNPLTKEVYAFPSNGGIQPIVSIDGWMKMINSHPEFDGMEFQDHVGDGGSLDAITCRIYRKDRSRPTEATEYMAECKRSTEPWNKWPHRMLRHKAAIQCARYAFSFAGIMDEDDFDRMKDVTPRQTVAERMAAARQAQAEDQNQDTQEGFSLSYVHETTATVVDQQAEDIPADDELQNEETPADDAPLHQEDTQQAGDDRNVLAEVADELDRCETPDEVNDVVSKFQEQLNALPENDKATARLKVKEAKARVKGGEA